MIAPTRRIWLYPSGRDRLEILVLGTMEDCAQMYARIKGLAERWVGWRAIETLSINGHAALGLAMTLTELAAYPLDPVAEGLAMLRDARGIAWHGGTALSEGHLGMVGLVTDPALTGAVVGK